VILCMGFKDSRGGWLVPMGQSGRPAQDSNGGKITHIYTPNDFKGEKTDKLQIGMTHPGYMSQIPMRYMRGSSDDAAALSSCNTGPRRATPAWIA
jgi:hypothetical protein